MIVNCDWDIYRVIHMSLRNFRTRLRNNQDRHSRVDIPSTCKVGQKLSSVSASVDMLPFGVTFPATLPRRSEITEGLMNYPIFVTFLSKHICVWAYFLKYMLLYLLVFVDMGNVVCSPFAPIYFLTWLIACGEVLLSACFACAHRS